MARSAAGAGPTAAVTVRRLRGFAGAAVATGAVTMTLGACGSKGGEGTAPATSGPGVGKPPIVLGAKGFSEQRILGQLYAQALRARGYDVRLREDIAADRIHAVLASGQIDGYLEYVDTLLSRVVRQTRPQPSAPAAYDSAKAYERRRGLTVLDRTPLANVDAVAVKPTFARQHRLRQVGDLERAGRVTLGGPRELETRRARGLADLRRTYGLTRLSFRPLSIGVQYTALDKAQIQAADVFSTDARLRGGRYTVLADPRHAFGFGHVIPIVNRKVISAEGPAFAQTINAVSAKLTTGAMRELNAAVDVDKETPEAAARRFLVARGLRRPAPQ
jgi:osmoprotectant transport system substrate-binding protein